MQQRGRPLLVQTASLSRHCLWRSAVRTIRTGAKARSVRSIEGSYNRRHQKKLYPYRPRDVYRASPLLLDLIDERNPSVRDYNEHDEADQQAKWSHNANLSGVFRRLKNFLPEIKQTEAKWAQELDRFDQRQLTERDVLSVAFLGVPQDAPVRRMPHGHDAHADVDADQNPIGDGTGPGCLERAVLRSIGLQPRVLEDTPLTVQTMLHRLEVQRQLQPVPKAGNPPARVTAGAAQELKTALNHSNFNGARRLITPLLQTDEGRALVAECAPEIIQECVRGLVVDDEGGAMTVFAFLTDVSRNLSAHGLEFDAASDTRVLTMRERLQLSRASTSTLLPRNPPDEALQNKYE